MPSRYTLGRWIRGAELVLSPKRSAPRSLLSQLVAFLTILGMAIAHALWGARFWDVFWRISINYYHVSILEVLAVSAFGLLGIPFSYRLGPGVAALSLLLGGVGGFCVATLDMLGLFHPHHSDSPLADAMLLKLLVSGMSVAAIAAGTGNMLRGRNRTTLD